MIDKFNAARLRRSTCLRLLRAAALPAALSPLSDHGGGAGRRAGWHCPAPITFAPPVCSLSGRDLSRPHLSSILLYQDCDGYRFLLAYVSPLFPVPFCFPRARLSPYFLAVFCSPSRGLNTSIACCPISLSSISSYAYRRLGLFLAYMLLSPSEP